MEVEIPRLRINFCGAVQIPPLLHPASFTCQLDKQSVTYLTGLFPNAVKRELLARG